MDHARVTFVALAQAMSAETPGEQRKLFEVVHRGIVVFDDYLCETFGFSRRPRGKYAQKKGDKNGES